MMRGQEDQQNPVEWNFAGNAGVNGGVMSRTLYTYKSFFHFVFSVCPSRI